MFVYNLLALAAFAPVSLSLRQTRHGASTSSPKRVAILGPIDSGTHLLASTLQSNYPSEMNNTCVPSGSGCTWIWKHSLGVNPIMDTLNGVTDNDLESMAIIAVVRSPLSLAAAWSIDPWDMSGCVDRPILNWDKPCTAHLGPSEAEKHIGMNNSLEWHFNFNSTMHVYMEYWRTYKLLRSSGVFNQVLIIRYEDLLLTPGAVIEHVGVSLKWPVPKDILVVEEPLKKSGTACSRAQAIEHLRTKGYLETLGSEGVEVLCRSLKDHLGYAKLKYLDVYVPKTEDYVDGVDVAGARAYDDECQ